MAGKPMTHDDLLSAYRAYLECLSARQLDRVGQFVHEDVEYGGEKIELSGYRKMLERDFREVPDVRFNIERVAVAARLAFDCTPVGRFLGLEVNGRRVSFCENVFYEYEDGKIRRVCSIIDKAAIEAQLGDRPGPVP
ncbi:hypothetical protein L284_20805 [Novosphingobium lindaniclasticum LE124]|uniref:Ester cyclase n=2 Tax=Novosphingobium TaxID=165696 RepID=T0GXR7_9SPHN|nr:hypothetical protein L284_20805 [Novosphingobium lindaniclasticum LE124]